MKFASWFWLWIGCVAVAAPPPRMAFPTEEARFDLLAPATVGALKNLEIKSPSGQVRTINWSANGQAGAGCTVSFPIKTYRWTECVLQFTPASNGTLTLKLHSPPALTNSPNQRQEIMWDDIAVEGIALTNGSFEKFIGNVPEGWTGGGVANVGPLPALTGLNYGRTWMQRYLAQPFTVQAGQTVSIRVNARSMPIMGPGALARITDRDTLAHQSARYYLRGINAGNFLDTSPEQPGAVTYEEADFRHMKQEGFDHVRFPIAWHQHLGAAPDFTIAPEFFSRVDTAVSNALKQGLFVIVNLHQYDAFTSDPLGHTNQFFAIWRQVSKHYAKAHPGIAFELLDEPKDAATTQVMNPIYAEALRFLHEDNLMRTVFLGPGNANSISELSKLWLPLGEENVIVTVHCYEPIRFTHQGTSRLEAEGGKLKGLNYPGPPAQPMAIPEGTSAHLRDWLEKYNRQPANHNPVSRFAFEQQLEDAAAWSEFYGRPVHIGEFGCHQSTDPLARARYLSDFRQTAERVNLSWALWDWKAAFAYWDAKNNQPLPGLHEALFAAPKK